MVLFGKKTENTFNLDVASPASLYVAFAVALSAFDSRFMCEWTDSNNCIYLQEFRTIKQMTLNLGSNQNKVAIISIKVLFWYNCLGDDFCFVVIFNAHCQIA